MNVAHRTNQFTRTTELVKLTMKRACNNTNCNSLNSGNTIGTSLDESHYALMSNYCIITVSLSYLMRLISNCNIS